MGVSAAPSPAASAWGLLAGAAAAALTIAMAGRVYGASFSNADVLVVSIALLVVLAAHHRAVRGGASAVRAGLALATMVFVAGVGNVLFTWWPSQSHGDGAFLVSVVAAGTPFSRWLVGSALLGWLHALWQFPPLRAAVPSALQTPQAFVQVMSCVAVYVAAVWLLRRRTAPFAAYVAVTSPVWLAFGLGYVEYYPFVAAVLVGVLAWIAGDGWIHLPPRTVGLVLGVVASVYVGLWPLAGLALAVFTMTAPRRHAWTAAWAAAALLGCVLVCWPGGPSRYFTALWHDMNFGEQSINPRYAGLSASPSSIYFKSAFVFSRAHLGEIGYLGFFSGTLAAALALAAALGAHVARGPREAFRALARPASLLLVLVAAYYTRFFFWKIPKLGLPGDFDLFFSIYLIVPFLTGLAWDRLDAQGPATRASRFALLSALAGHMVPVCYVVTCKGLPAL
jgi:hypothetical protein